MQGLVFSLGRLQTGRLLAVGTAGGHIGCEELQSLALCHATLPDSTHYGVRAMLSTLLHDAAMYTSCSLLGTTQTTLLAAQGARGG